MKKIIISLMVVFMLVLSVSAYENATIVGSSASGKAGDTVKIEFSIVNNPGLASCTTYVCYDRGALKLKSFTPEAYVKTSSAYATSQTVDKYPYVVVFINTAEKTGDAVMYSLEFEILDSASNGDYPIYFFFRDKDCTNVKNELLTFDIVNGNITVENEEGFVPTEKKEYTVVVFPTSDNNQNTEEAEEDVIKEVNEYPEGYYTDLVKEEWYYEEVISSYKLGLMDGKGDGIFDPEGTLKVSEGITLAVRLAERYSGNSGTLEAKEDEEWYTPYVNYAIEKGIITENYFEDYEAELSRADMAYLIAKALPEECFEQKNEFDTLSDVEETDARYESILKLYRAGIVLGVNENYDYLPEQSIKRSEVSAIMNRVARPLTRKSK